MAPHSFLFETRADLCFGLVRVPANLCDDPRASPKYYSVESVVLPRDQANCQLAPSLVLDPYTRHSVCPSLPVLLPLKRYLSEGVHQAPPDRGFNPRIVSREPNHTPPWAMYQALPRIPMLVPRGFVAVTTSFPPLAPQQLRPSTVPSAFSVQRKPCRSTTSRSLLAITLEMYQWLSFVFHARREAGAGFGGRGAVRCNLAPEIEGEVVPCGG